MKADLLNGHKVSRLQIKGLVDRAEATLSKRRIDVHLLQQV